MRVSDSINIDHVGPFITSKLKNRHILVIVDNLTKFCILYAVKNVEAKTTIKKMEDFVNMYGPPSRIIADRGTSFTANEFKGFCFKHGIRHSLNSTAHPQAN